MEAARIGVDMPMSSSALASRDRPRVIGTLEDRVICVVPAAASSRHAPAPGAAGPNGPAVVRMLIEAGADPSGPCEEGPSETPLHWAGSSDDADVAAALIDGGADLEAPGASIAGGGPLDNAVGYGCWHVARLLVERGARVDSLWQATALGIGERVTDILGADPAPTQEDLDEAFYQACCGGQLRMADLLLGRGADIDSRPGYSNGMTPLDMAGSTGTRRGQLVTWLRERGATSGKESAREA